jgi:hypothetical protein
VLADIKSQGKVDAYWVLGDFAALGYDPVTPLEKVTALSHASFTRGNTDRYVVTEDLPVQPEKALQDPTLLPEVIEAVRSFSWTRGYLSAAGWLDWLMNVPLARSFDLTRWHALARRSCFSRKRRRTRSPGQAQR